MNLPRQCTVLGRHLYHWYELFKLLHTLYWNSYLKCELCFFCLCHCLCPFVSLSLFLLFLFPIFFPFHLPPSLLCPPPHLSISRYGGVLWWQKLCHTPTNPKDLKPPFQVCWNQITLQLFWYKSRNEQSLQSLNRFYRLQDCSELPYCNADIWNIAKARHEIMTGFVAPTYTLCWVQFHCTIMSVDLKWLEENLSQVSV